MLYIMHHFLHYKAKRQENDDAGRPTHGYQPLSEEDWFKEHPQPAPIAEVLSLYEFDEDGKRNGTTRWRPAARYGLDVKTFVPPSGAKWELTDNSFYQIDNSEE